MKIPFELDARHAPVHKKKKEPAVLCINAVQVVVVVSKKRVEYRSPPSGFGAAVDARGRVETTGAKEIKSWDFRDVCRKKTHHEPLRWNKRWNSHCNKQTYVKRITLLFY
jgi:hypothetical protein